MKRAIALRNGPAYPHLRATRPALRTLPPLPEKRFQGQIIKLAKLFGWREYFVFNSEGSPKGWPDLVLIRPPHGLIWELKTDTGRLTADQRDTLKALQEVKHWDVRVVRPRDWRWILRMLEAA